MELQSRSGDHDKKRKSNQERLTQAIVSKAMSTPRYLPLTAPWTSTAALQNFIQSLAPISRIQVCI
jgi:hypothetical protein